MAAEIVAQRLVRISVAPPHSTTCSQWDCEERSTCEYISRASVMGVDSMMVLPYCQKHADALELMRKPCE